MISWLSLQLAWCVPDTNSTINLFAQANNLICELKSPSEIIIEIIMVMELIAIFTASLIIYRPL